jgi:3-oxoacyl-[acyl-carrier protein] reductase
MDLQITGKKALVCGASAGVGKAIADGLAAEGADVFLCARNEEALKKLCSDIQQRSKVRAEYYAGDLSEQSARDGLFARAKEKFGSVDILIHNTGGPKPTHAEETTIEQWQQGFDSLFKSVVDLNSKFLPAMKQQRWGRVISTTSLSVIEPIAGLAVSNGIRSAVTAMLKTLADEVASHNITVNCVAPGAIATGRIEDLIEARAKKANVSTEQYHTDYIKAIPAARLGTPEEFAAVVCFLASERASYITGSTISVDGGKRRSTY